MGRSPALGTIGGGPRGPPPAGLRLDGCRQKWSADGSDSPALPLAIRVVLPQAILGRQALATPISADARSWRAVPTDEPTPPRLRCVTGRARGRCPAGHRCGRRAGITAAAPDVTRGGRLSSFRPTLEGEELRELTDASSKSAVHGTSIDGVALEASVRSWTAGRLADMEPTMQITDISARAVERHLSVALMSLC
jgi:hypothetical protein